MVQQFRFFAHVVFQKIVFVFLIGLLATLALSSSLAAPMDTPPAAVLAEAKQIVKQMIDNPRGPYSRIRWYCKDGSVLAPQASACKQRGGGMQHAEFSSDRTRLADLGWSVGTIYAPLNFSDLKNQRPREQRLRELALEKYLSDVDDGWVLRKAKDYRGRAQLEDETASGKKILLAALTDLTWLEDNYLLVRELARVIPHGEEDDLSRRVRRAAIDLAERAPSAESLRAEIHSSPSKNSARRLDAWMQQTKLSADLIELATSLINDLDLLYGESGRRFRLEQRLNSLGKSSFSTWQADVRQSLQSTGQKKISSLCKASKQVRQAILASASPSQRLSLIDSLGGIETEVHIAFLDSQAGLYKSRESILQTSESLLECVYGSGLISAAELDSATRGLATTTSDLDAYKAAVAQLKRVPGWAASNVRYTFAEALISYAALDRRAVRFTDDLLRESPLWVLGDVLRVLSVDIARLRGNEVLIAEKQVSSAIALNPGMARGTLRIFETLDEAEQASPAPSDIVALPETIAELKPVAGILTLGEGNALSHVQLLARNFGIPNVAIDFSIIDLLKPLEGREVVLVVSTDGNVVLRLAEKVDSLEQLFPIKNASNDGLAKISVPAANLAPQKILNIDEIGRHMSGKVIGPKAANLGELKRLFPGRVAPALAVPFGIYQSHLITAGIDVRIKDAYKKRTAGALSNEQLNVELESISRAITTLKLSDNMQSELISAMQAQFGDPGSYGVFVRSDTNVEDLPQFTGAGLSETLANIVGTDNIFVGIPRVWASVLSPRAIAWRSSLLSNPEQIYASVLLMKSVPAEKSGVLVTANLADPSRSGLTVSTAWGVGGAVSGEAAEGLVIAPDGTTQLISEAKTPYQRNLNRQGGVNWVPARSGQVLTQSEIPQLQELAAEVGRKYQPVFDELGRQRPWDIEFGFLNGELTLFQIRPLVEKNAARANTTMKILRPDMDVSLVQTNRIDLSAMPEGLAQPQSGKSQ